MPSPAEKGKFTYFFFVAGFLAAVFLAAGFFAAAFMAAGFLAAAFFFVAIQIHPLSVPLHNKGIP